MGSNLHLLKLVTGVEISTRPVRRSGSAGKTVKRASLRTAAPIYRPAVRPNVTLPPFIAQLPWQNGKRKCARCKGRFSHGVFERLHPVMTAPHLSS